MRGNGMGRILRGGLALMVFCGGWVSAETGARAPQFDLRTLNGETYNNASLRGRAVLLEFWQTRCADCRKGQAAVDEIARDYSGQKLAVVAVDVGESGAQVKKYLEAHPAAVPVALDQGRKLSARFGKHGVPFYVLIDRDGYIAGTQNGVGGEDALLSLLSLAGLSGHAAGTQAGTPRPAAQPGGQPDAQGGAALPVSAPKVSPPKIIELPHEAGSVPQKPSPKTVFVLANGERLESDKYTMDGGILQIEVGGEQHAIALNALDLKATVEVNHERGIELKIPESSSEVFVAF